MTEHWQIVVVTIMAMGVLDGLTLWAVRFIVARVFAGQRDQYRDQLTDAAKKCEGAAKKCEEASDKMSEYQAIERQVLELKGILPLEYVRKEDFIRHEVVINAKLDRIMDRLPGGNQCNTR